MLALVTSPTVLLGFVAAVAGTSAALLYDLIRRFEERKMIEDQRSVLLSAVENHPWLLAELREIAVNACATLERPHQAALFVELMKSELGRTRNFVQDINRGRLRVPSGNATPMAHQIDLVQRSVHATTIPEADNEWWLSAGGMDYLERNYHAITERGVTIERIVLWENIDEELAQVVHRQRLAGVDLLFVRRTTVPAELQVSIAIYDETIVHDVVFNHDGVDIFYEYVVDRAAVAQARDKFARLRVLATSTEPAQLLALLERIDMQPSHDE